MSENSFEHTTSIAGLTCDPLSILSETISPQEMSKARGGNGAVCGGCTDPHPPIEDPDPHPPYPPDCSPEPTALPEPEPSLWEDITETAEEVWDEVTETAEEVWEETENIVEDVWDWLTDDEEEEDYSEDETEDETEVYDP